MSTNESSVVLLVEDEPLVRLVVSELLLDSGFRVIEAANAAEALAVLESGLAVHVLLADVDMPPGINGYALAHQVRERWPGIEILMTSGRQWPGEGDLPAGAAFLAKPCPNESIVLHVGSAAQRARAARPAARADAKIIPFPKTA
jgi:CheY-like chemotaxis protein